MGGKFWLTLQTCGAHGLVRGTLRGNEGPSSLKGSLVAMELIKEADLYRIWLIDRE